MTEALYKISLAQWSLHRALFDGYVQSIDFPRITREQFGIEAVEYVNSFFPDRQPNKEFVKELANRCKDSRIGVRPIPSSFIRSFSERIDPGVKSSRIIFPRSRAYA